MKTTNRILILMAFLMTLTPNLFSQENAKRPEFVAVTTMHWNMNQTDFDMDTWKSVEKEFLDKVTSKNEYVMSASYYLHQLTPDNSELLYVQTFASWDDIEKSSAKNEELTKMAWPNEAERKAFLKKQSHYYANEHSDEIYATLPGAKLMTAKPDKDLILYIRKSHFAFPDDGNQEEFKSFRKERLDNIINKNKYIKAYYPSVHAWGSDKTDFIEAYILESICDYDKMFDENSALYKAKWPDKNERKARGKKISKYFTGQHGDFIYKSVHELSK